MPTFFALMWKVKPGSEAVVEELFRTSRPPEDVVVRAADGSVAGRLIGTLVFMKEDVVLRVAEFEGAPEVVFQHLRRQPELAELEAALRPHLVTSRDLSTPEGAQAFFGDAAMRCILARRHGE